MKDPEFDSQLAREFGTDVEQAIAGNPPQANDELESWLATIILLDQFARNIYRGSERMYAGDELALTLARRVLSHPRRDELPVTYQTFVCMPLMHAEDLPAQEECVAHFERLFQLANDQLKPGLKQNLEYARLHRDIVARFGRFPHRNALLGRETTAEEAEFLKTPGSSF